MTVAQDDIAIIGMGCRFPGEAKSPKEFLEMLLKGRSGWSEVPKDRFNIDAYWHPSYERHGTIVSRGGHFLKDDVGLFDAPFFSMTRAEASAMDPQHRMLLEITYESLENAGIPLEKVIGSDTACFVGGFTREYDTVTTTDLDDTLLYATTGNGLTMMSNRVSWFYDLRGPSVSLDTACSSSLVALHLACQAIRSSKSETRQSLVAGANLILIPDQMTTMNPLHFLSPDSQCYSFDDRANGYVRGEGVGVLVLKHVDDAIRDNDNIRAVIRGTGVNQDGKTPGITLPSSEAQISLIRSTYESAGLDPADTAYFEAHGTGTAAGDPLEMSAIGAVFDRSTKPFCPPLYVGTVKPNIGHLEAGAGLAGIIKTVLSLEAGVIPPNINFQTPNPKLRIEEYNFAVPTRPTAWPTRGLRRASVNSFGYGGTNGHCILDDAFHYLSARGLYGRTHSVDVAPLLSPISNSTDSGIGSAGEDDEFDLDHFPEKSLPTQQKVFVLSAPEQNALPRLAESHSVFLKDRLSRLSQVDDVLEDLAFTLSSRRSVFPWRTAVLAGSAKNLSNQLLKPVKPTRASKSPNLLFCFNGQGAQWYAMGRELLIHGVFEESVLTADRYLQAIGATWSVLEELCASESTTNINKPQFSQPLCAVLQIALVDLLRHWNILPTVVIGHSSGEIGAAYALGALSAEDCWKTAFHRGRLSSKIRDIAPQLNGSMIAVGLGENELQPYIEKLALSETDVLVTACINSPSNITVSGDEKCLRELEALLKADDVFCRKLAVENAYHSAHMLHIADDYHKSIKDIKPAESTARATMVSSVTGKPITAQNLDASYWVDNMVSPVQFVNAIEYAFQPVKSERRRRGNQSIDTIVEIGPHSALQGPVKQILVRLHKTEDTTYLSALRRGTSAVDTALGLAGALWTLGVNVNLEHVNNTHRVPKKHIPLVDLPQYPWNHQNRYWHESALSKSHRFRHAPRTDLLGAPVQEFTRLQPAWKNMIRLSELPWISEHKVRGNDVFPATGMICAALEGARQLVDRTRTVESFELRDVIIGRALIIPPSDPGVQVFTRFNPRKGGMRSDLNLWYEFKFVSLEVSQSNERNYVEHASGLVSINYRPESSEMGEMSENEAEARCARERYFAARRDCTQDVSPESHYGVTTRMGFDYGPLFQGLTEAKRGVGEACFTITITDTKSMMPAQFEYGYLLHPTTLDVALQTTSQAMEHARMGSGTESMVPTGVESLRVSASIPREAHTELVGFSTAVSTGYRDHSATVMISTASWEKTMLEIHNLSFTGLGDNTDQMIDDDQAVAVRKLCSKNVWKADIDLLDQQKGEPQWLCGQGVETPDEITAWGASSTQAAAIYIKRALKALRPQAQQSLPPHLKLYLEWMRDKHDIAKAGKLDYQKVQGGRWLEMSVEDEDGFLEKYAQTYPADGKLVCAVGQNLPAIIDGTAQPLPIMLEDDMLIKIYAEGHALKSGLDIFQRWFDLQGHKQPGMRVLEIGAGTGSITLPVLKALGGTGGRTPRFGSYCFTDISTGWFEKAKELFKEWSGRLDFKKLDIEEDPIAQGFEAESFDVIAASNVLHATKKLEVTLANCRRLLKPGGKLVIGELTYSIDHIGLVFGTLPGWWLSEDGREGGPLITQEEWHRRLQLAGFTGLDVAVAVKDTYEVAKLSMMVSTKPASIMASTPLRKLLVVKSTPASEIGATLGAAISRCFADGEVDVELTSLEAASSMALQGQLSKPGLGVVSLLECDEPVFARCGKDVFEAIRNIILHSSKLFWVTCSASPDGTRDPESCAISGLFRTAKSENPRLSLHELHLRKRLASQSADAASVIARVIRNVYSANEEQEYEDEIVEIDGMLNVPRLVDDESLNRTIQTLGTTPQPELQLLLQANRPLKLTVGKPGLLETLHFTDDDRILARLPDDHVEVQVHANALNYNDVLVALGHISDHALGVDVAGTVKRVGSNVKRLKAGDRVAFLTPGAMCTMARVSGDLPQLLPNNMSFEEGATIPLVFMAAYQSLVETAHLSGGERVLVHAAAGGLGQAMIQIAKHLGAEIFVTVSSPEKRDLMMNCGVPEDHIFNSRSLSFAKAIKRMTGGKGVDVVINTLAGEAMRETWGCISPFGRFVELGKKDILANNSLDMKHFLPNVSFASVNIQHICWNAPARAATLLEKVFNLFHLGVTKVVDPVTIFDYSNVEQAFSSMQNGHHTGKLVLKATEKSLVPTVPHDTHPLELDPDATYVLVGGLGGLGRSLAVYLADHGAKHLAFFSRTADGLNPKAQQVLDLLRDRSVQAVVYGCDVSDAAVLKTTMARMSNEMPRIRGVIQGAMVLRDGLYETMPYENWIQATRPKIEGSWNLHELMPKELDFFVMLSSVSGIVGNRGQSNYCAGNTYQDALAHYRRSQGLTAQTVDLGAIGGMGWFEENKEDLSFAKTMENLIINENEFFCILKSAMTGYSHGENRTPTQLVTGAGSGGLNKANLAAGATKEYYWLHEAARMAFLRQLDLHSTSQAEEGGETGELKGSLTAVTSLAQATDVIQGAVAVKLAKAMMIAVNEIDVNRPVSSYGVDSLVAAEMRNWCFRELKADINVFELLSGTPIVHLSGQIAERSALVPEGVRTAAMVVE